jgi:hypothetical protein
MKLKTEVGLRRASQEYMSRDPIILAPWLRRCSRFLRVEALVSACWHLMGCGLVIALLVGCGTPPPGGTLSGSPDRPSPRPAFTSPSSPETKAPEQADPEMRVDRRVHGRVVSVNLALRFVVIDFPIWRMPLPEQHLGVYRAGQKVGEVKITGPALETTVAGDLITGEAQRGDEVSED